MGKDKIMEHNTRVEQIKTYLERLSAGEELEKVRADFAKEFKEVDPAEIMQAEQELLQGGTPLETVQKLCDVHAALFRGATSEEKIANAEQCRIGKREKAGGYRGFNRNHRTSAADVYPRK